MINHAFRFTLPAGDINPQYIYPASHMVSESQNANNLPMGARLRLKNTAAQGNLRDDGAQAPFALESDAG